MGCVIFVCLYNVRNLVKLSVLNVERPIPGNGTNYLQQTHLENYIENKNNKVPIKTPAHGIIILSTQ